MNTPFAKLIRNFISCVLILLSGSSKENYIRHLVKDGESQGFR